MRLTSAGVATYVWGSAVLGGIGSCGAVSFFTLHFGCCCEQHSGHWNTVTIEERYFTAYLTFIVQRINVYSGRFHSTDVVNTRSLFLTLLLSNRAGINWTFRITSRGLAYRLSNGNKGRVTAPRGEVTAPRWRSDFVGPGSSATTSLISHQLHGQHMNREIMAQRCVRRVTADLGWTRTKVRSYHCLYLKLQVK